MRIAFVTESWLPSTNGVVTRLAATVSELCRRGHEVLIIAPRGGEPRFAGAQVREVPAFSISFVYGGHPWGLPMPRVARYLEEFQPDLVHVVNPLLLGMAGVWAARRYRIPLVASYHTDVARYAGFYHLGWLRPVIRWVTRRLHGRAAVNLATSTRVCADLRAQGIDNVRLWRRGVDLAMFHPRAGRTGTDRRGPRTSGRVTALYVGRIAEEKGIARLAPLVTPPGRVDLVLVGDGPDRVPLARRLAGTPVTFTGTLHGNALAEAYADADVFVFGSTTETLGLVLLEALASGLPVVSVDTPASREMLGHNPAARLFQPDRPDQLATLVDELLDSAPRDALAATARAEAERWGWPAATDELLDLYRHARQTSPAPTRVDHPLREFARFLAVGASNAAVDLGVFNLMLLAAPSHTPVQLAAYNTVAVLASIANSYLWNSRWTFRHHRAPRGRARLRQRLLFLAQGAANIVVNDVVVGVGATLLTAAGLEPPRLASNLAKLIAMISASLTSYVILKVVVFRTRHDQPPTHRERGRQGRGARVGAGRSD